MTPHTHSISVFYFPFENGQYVWHLDYQRMHADGTAIYVYFRSVMVSTVHRQRSGKNAVSMSTYIVMIFETKRNYLDLGELNSHKQYNDGKKHYASIENTIQ